MKPSLVLALPLTLGTALAACGSEDGGRESNGNVGYSGGLPSSGSGGLSGSGSGDSDGRSDETGSEGASRDSGGTTTATPSGGSTGGDPSSSSPER